jgi:hypothetical protein
MQCTCTWDEPTDVGGNSGGPTRVGDASCPVHKRETAPGRNPEPWSNLSEADEQRVADLELVVTRLLTGGTIRLRGSTQEVTATAGDASIARIVDRVRRR